MRVTAAARVWKENTKQESGFRKLVLGELRLGSFSSLLNRFGTSS